MSDRRPDPRDVPSPHVPRRIYFGPYSEVLNDLQAMLVALLGAHARLSTEGDVPDADLVDYPRRLAMSIEGYLKAFVERPLRGPFVTCPACTAARLRLMRLDPRRERWRAQCALCGVRAWISPGTGRVTLAPRDPATPPRGPGKGGAVPAGRERPAARPSSPAVVPKVRDLVNAVIAGEEAAAEEALRRALASHKTVLQVLELAAKLNREIGPGSEGASGPSLVLIGRDPTIERFRAAAAEVPTHDLRQLGAGPEVHLRPRQVALPAG